MHFEEEGVPVDIYGVGGSLLKIHIGFTGDNVLLNGEHEAKADDASEIILG